jgi:hypothetical protein
MHVALESVQLLVNLLTAFKVGMDVWRKIKPRTR